MKDFEYKVGQRSRMLGKRAVYCAGMCDYSMDALTWLCTACRGMRQLFAMITLDTIMVFLRITIPFLESPGLQNSMRSRSVIGSWPSSCTLVSALAMRSPWLQGRHSHAPHTHADRSKDPGSVHRFKAVSEAHRILSDQSRKRLLDDFLHGRSSMSIGPTSGASFVDQFAGVSSCVVRRVCSWAAGARRAGRWAGRDTKAPGFRLLPLARLCSTHCIVTRCFQSMIRVASRVRRALL